MEPQVNELNSMRMTNLVEAAEEQARQALTDFRYAYINTTVKVDVATLQAAADIFSPCLDRVKAINGMVFSFTMQPYPVSLLKRTEPAGGGEGDVLGLSPHDGPLVSILLLLYWNKTEDDETVLGTAKEILEAIDTDAAARGMSVPFKYLDYAFSFQDPIDKYGLENQTKLQEASRRYHGMLQNGVPGGFKLFQLGIMF
ncbi:hypothetical protein PG987_014085 [Apiospora arundinis]